MVDLPVVLTVKKVGIICIKVGLISAELKVVVHGVCYIFPINYLET